jgi:hypothetical protein
VIVEENSVICHGRVHRPEHEDLLIARRRSQLWTCAFGLGCGVGESSIQRRQVQPVLRRSSSSGSTPRPVRRHR